MNVLKFENDGPLLVASDYWQSEMAAAGKLYVSINAGCFRLLVPQRQHGFISDMRPEPNTSSSQCCPGISGSIGSIASSGWLRTAPTLLGLVTFLRVQLTALRTTKTLAKSGAAAQNYWLNKQLRVSDHAGIRSNRDSSKG
jgi:hypothetical protein